MFVAACGSIGLASVGRGDCNITVTDLPLHKCLGPQDRLVALVPCFVVGWRDMLLSGCVFDGSGGHWLCAVLASGGTVALERVESLRA
jgi:hypothetical protein